MFKFLLFPAVLSVVVYAALSDAGLTGTLKFAFVLFLTLCVVVIYALATRAKRRSDGVRNYQ